MLERPCYISKIRATKKKGTAPYRACDAELAARVSKLAFSLSRLQVSDYFRNIGACHLASTFLLFPFPHARFIRVSIFVHSSLRLPPLFNVPFLSSDGLFHFFIAHIIIDLVTTISSLPPIILMSLCFKIYCVVGK